MEKQVLALLTAPQRGHNAKLRQGLLSDNGRGAPIGAPLFFCPKERGRYRHKEADE